MDQQLPLLIFVSLHAESLLRIFLQDGYYSVRGPEHYGSFTLRVHKQ
jgi:hypothetical protein